MFDPMNATGAFQIDYVRLSTVDPSTPDNIPPQLAITSPSFISGPDYATTVVGNSWDMDDAADVTTQYNTWRKLQRRVYNATNTNGNFDPAVVLHVTTPIDTSRFKYVTYRMKSMDKIRYRAARSRASFGGRPSQQQASSNDNVVYEGFQTVSFDLNKIKLEAGSPIWAASTPKVFRLDPHEFTTPRTFHLDYVMLTGIPLPAPVSIFAICPATAMAPRRHRSSSSITMPAASMGRRSAVTNSCFGRGGRCVRGILAAD